MPASEPLTYVSAGARLGAGVSLAPGAVVHAGTRIGEGTRIGSGAVIHEGTVVGRRCTIEDGAVLGKRPQLRRRSSALGKLVGALVVADDVTICCHAVVYAGARIDEAVIIGDQSQVRERCAVGRDSVVGRGSCLEFDVTVGARALIQTNAYITAHSIVEDDVFVGPGVTTTNDDAMGRLPPGAPLTGAVFRRACRVGGGVVVVPGVEIGEEAYVAAGAVVTKDVRARETVMGVPARVVRMVDERDLLDGSG